MTSRGAWRHHGPGAKAGSRHYFEMRLTWAHPKCTSVLFPAFALFSWTMFPLMATLISCSINPTINHQARAPLRTEGRSWFCKLTNIHKRNDWKITNKLQGRSRPASVRWTISEQQLFSVFTVRLQRKRSLSVRDFIFVESYSLFPFEHVHWIPPLSCYTFTVGIFPGKSRNTCSARKTHCVARAITRIRNPFVFWVNSSGELKGKFQRNLTFSLPFNYYKRLNVGEFRCPLVLRMLRGSWIFKFTLLPFLRNARQVILRDSSMW